MERIYFAKFPDFFSIARVTFPDFWSLKANTKLKGCARHEAGYYIMIKKIFLAVAIVIYLTTADMIGTNFGLTGNACMAAAPNYGTYSRTGSSVSVFHENGHPKGTFAVYLHHGKRYIDFNNKWICIQGKKRFGYCGNWYVIR